MVKDRGTGGKNRKKSKGVSSKKPRELVIRNIDMGEEYAQIIKSIGNGFMDVYCYTSGGKIKKRAHIRGVMRKRIWMGPGDIVLVSNRGFEDSTCDILMKYTSDEAKILKNMKELPADIDINVTDVVEGSYDVIFDEEDTDTTQEVKSTVPRQKQIEDINSDSDSDSENKYSTNLDDL